MGRSVVLARELQKRGHRVVLAGTPKYLRDPDVVRPGEFELYELPDFYLDHGLEVLRRVRKLPSTRIIEENLTAELDMLNRVRPSVAIVDFRPTMYLSTRLKGIPVISLLGGRWVYQYASTPYKAFRTYALYPWIRRIVGERGADLFMPSLQRAAMRYKMLPFSLAYRRHGLAPKWAPWEMIVGDYNLILDTELLSPTGPLPDTFRRVGPIFWTSEVPLPAWAHGLASGKAVIYVTMGSTGHAALFRHLLRVLAESGYVILMSTGGQVELAREEIPKTAYVEKYLPGGRIMQLADMVIHHGGAGTVYQALQAGRPSIIIATHFEQELLGAAVEEHRAGIFLTLREVMADPAVLTGAMTRMLGNLASYRANAERLRQDLLRYDSVKLAADAVEEFLSRR
ncbi:MAG: hypothetical protein HY725_11165 [Candidatus Rokubacteria bacterium]|nr:hypothetical protein [Candidatus Rokubacteria bacterium]